MRKFLLPLLLVTMLAGCNAPSSSNSGGGITPPEEPQEDNYNVKSISFSVRELILVKGKTSNDLTTVYFNSVQEPTDDEKELTWSVDDSSIVSVGQYGQVTALKVGETYVTATTVIASRKVRCLVTVVNSMDDIQREYQRVDDVSTLKDKDTIVFAAPTRGLTATLDSQGSYLHAVETEFSSDKSKIVTLGANTAEFYLGDCGEKGFTLESQELKYFAGFNLTRVGFVANKGNVEWKFTLYEGKLYIETYNDVRGWLMFNDRLDNSHGGFTLYESSVNAGLFMPTIYRLTKVK